VRRLGVDASPGVAGELTGSTDDGGWRDGVRGADSTGDGGRGADSATSIGESRTPSPCHGVERASPPGSVERVEEESGSATVDVRAAVDRPSSPDSTSPSTTTTLEEGSRISAPEGTSQSELSSPSVAAVSDFTVCPEGGGAIGSSSSLERMMTSAPGELMVGETMMTASYGFGKLKTGDKKMLQIGE